MLKQEEGGRKMGNNGKVVPKGLTFQPCDERLVLDIMGYQEQKGLPTFIAAVRELCNEALKLKL